MGAKRIAAIVALLAIIVLAGYWMSRKLGGRDEPPEWYLGQARELVDTETGELISQPVEKWQSGRQLDGKFKNPKTGDYTMVKPIVCASCGAKIAPPDYPSRPASEPSTRTRTDARRDPVQDAYEAEVDQIWHNHMCPKCGERATRGGSPPPHLLR